MTEKKVRSEEKKKQPVVVKQGDAEAAYDKLIDAETEILEAFELIRVNLITSSLWAEAGKQSIQTGFMQLRRSVMRPHDK